MSILLFKKMNRGFTLIELLVVIAIVGIMSAVILGQLNSARGKGFDAQARSAFRNMANPATFYYYDVNGESYFNVCSYNTSPAKFQSILNGVSGATCSSAASGYRVYVQLQVPNQFGASSGTDYLCTDASGNIKVLDTSPAAGTVCP